MPPTPTDAAPHHPADRLLALAISDPRRALSEARSVLDAGPDMTARSMAHQAAGIVLRDDGQLPAALHELRTALQLARRAGPVERVVDVRATYGAALIMAGRTRDGLIQLDAAVQLARGGLLARVRLRRAHALSLLGRHTEALDDLQLALRTVRRHHDVLWEAHVVNNRCLVHLALGAVDRADQDAEEAERLYSGLGHEVEAIQAIHNQGLVALRRGDLPVALERLDRAGERYEKVGVREPDLVMDRTRALLLAGLTTEADVMAEEFVGRASDMKPVKRAELLLVAAAAALAVGRVEVALQRAKTARRLFASQQRDLWETRAAFLTVQAHYAGGRRDGRLLDVSCDLAEHLRLLQCEDAPLAYLLSGRLALELGSEHRGTHNLSEAARYRLRGPALQRATGWLAVAVEAEYTGRARQLVAACRHGLDAVDEHRMAFGGTELRALATGHGRDLATIATRHALRRGRARDLLTWTERWRATALAPPALRPPDDPELGRDLAALRDAARRADEAQTSTAGHVAARERDRWEAAVRRRRMKVAHRAATPTRFDLDSFFATLAAVPTTTDPAQAVVLVESDGALLALVVAGRRIRRCLVGPFEAARREVDFAQFALRAAAYGRSTTSLQETGERLQRRLLGPAAELLRGGPVVVVPPAHLHGAPWGLLPALAGTALTVSPSLFTWMEAGSRPVPTNRRVALIMGPGLSGAEAEVVAINNLHREVSMLRGGQATAERALSCLDGAWLAHIAAHGSFRSDSPLFSSLILDDGPLTVHDLDRLERAPYRMVLSACDVGGGEAVGTDELLGLVTSLLALGTTGVLASVVPVNDVAAVPVMTRVHTELAQGRNLAEACLAARNESAPDPLAVATAASFTPWGV